MQAARNGPGGSSPCGLAPLAPSHPPVILSDLLYASQRSVAGQSRSVVVSQFRAGPNADPNSDASRHERVQRSEL